MQALGFPTSVARDSIDVTAQRAADDFVHSPELLSVVGGIEPTTIRLGKVLGHGRAAQARLVEISCREGHSRLAVEKNFSPGLLTRLIYRIVFQAPFAYQHTEDAILACYYRRRVVSAILRARMPALRVARPLYIRRDRASDSWILAAEFIRGRGIRPAPADPFVGRRWLAERFARSSRPPAPNEEINELLAKMNSLEGLLQETGLVGTGWQVCTRALVSTANLLRTDDGYCVVDLESGIPAMLVGRYVKAGLRLGSLPLFDDVDAPRLENWLNSNGAALSTKLGGDGYRELCGDAERLSTHTARWKQSEFALQRNRASIFGAPFRQRFKTRLLDSWRRREIIDETADAAIRPGNRIFARPTFLLGLAPGRVGRFLQRVWANRAYRAQVRRFLYDREFRRDAIANAVEHRTASWRRAKRLASHRELHAVTPSFAIHWLLSKTAPVGIHRWLTDPLRRRHVAAHCLGLALSARYQRAYGCHVLRDMILDWQSAGRLTEREVENLRAKLHDNELDEYVRCFSMHLSLKLLAPLLAPLKVGGLAATFATGNPLYLLPFLIGPACRTAISLWRMLGRTRRHIRYTEALLVGVLPIIGTLAYAVQMRAAHPDLAELLVRDAAARIGRWMPIYGGKDSRVEIWAIKSANILFEATDLLQASLRPLERWTVHTPYPTDESIAAPPPILLTFPSPAATFSNEVGQKNRVA